MLRQFKETHIDEDLTQTATDYDNALLFGCLFDDLRGRTFKNCDMNRSRVLTGDVQKLLGFTVTLDCHSFKNVELSETVFDVLLLLLFSTKGNDSKRRKLLRVIGRDRASMLRKQLEVLE